MDKQIIFEKREDLRLVTIRRGGTLNDSDHRLIAKWAADCAQHVLYFSRRRDRIMSVHA